jgi:hypothetical protein
MDHFNYTEENEFDNLLYKFNLHLTHNITSTLNTLMPSNLDYTIKGSNLINYIYDKNIMCDINNNIKYNVNIDVNYDKVKGSTLYEKINNSKWNLLKKTDIDQLVQSPAIDIFIQPTSPIDLTKTKNKLDLKVSINKICKNLLDMFNKNLLNITNDIKYLYEEIDVLPKDPSIIDLTKITSYGSIPQIYSNLNFYQNITIL